VPPLRFLVYPFPLSPQARNRFHPLRRMKGLTFFNLPFRFYHACTRTALSVPPLSSPSFNVRFCFFNASLTSTLSDLIDSYTRAPFLLKATSILPFLWNLARGRRLTSSKRRFGVVGLGVGCFLFFWGGLEVTGKPRHLVDLDFFRPSALIPTFPPPFSPLGGLPIPFTLATRRFVFSFFPQMSTVSRSLFFFFLCLSIPVSLLSSATLSPLEYA